MKTMTIIAMALSLCSIAAHGQAADHVATLTVSDRALLEIPADRVTLEIGVFVEDWKLDDARKQAEDRMQAIRKGLDELGLQATTDYGEIQVDIMTVWSKDGQRMSSGRNTGQRRATTQRAGASQDAPPEVHGYEVTSRLVVNTDKLSLAPRILEQAATLGGNETGYLEYTVADLKVHERAAMKQAVASAMADAATLAEASGSRLLRLSSLELVAAGKPSRTSTGRGQPRNPTPSKTVEVHATVKLVYQIAPADPGSASGKD